MTRTREEIPAPNRPEAPDPGRKYGYDAMQVLQSLIELQKDISAIGTKTDRLISDHAKLDSRVASIAETLTFIKGAAFAATMLIPVCAALVGG